MPSNRILSRLSRADFALLEPHLEAVDLPVKKSLETRKRRIDQSLLHRSPALRPWSPTAATSPASSAHSDEVGMRSVAGRIRRSRERAIRRCARDPRGRRDSLTAPRL